MRCREVGKCIVYGPIAAAISKNSVATRVGLVRRPLPRLPADSHVWLGA